jgi:single-stranded DNA-binding protein
MREFSVTGNLGADAEVLTDKNGSNYIRFRLANHEFGDQENETRWFDVTMFSVPRISSFLKKGTGVRVIGDYKDSVYESEKYGTQINRNITAFKIDFWNSGKREDGEQQSESKTAETKPAPVAAEKPKATKSSKAAKAESVPAAPTMPAEGGEDDLPF